MTQCTGSAMWDCSEHPDRFHRTSVVCLQAPRLSKYEPHRRQQQCHSKQSCSNCQRALVSQKRGVRCTDDAGCGAGSARTCSTSTIGRHAPALTLLRAFDGPQHRWRCLRSACSIAQRRVKLSSLCGSCAATMARGSCSGCCSRNVRPHNL